MYRSPQGAGTASMKLEIGPVSLARRPKPVSDTGITVLYQPAGKTPELDIVFVHGLQGHPRKTWYRAVPPKANSAQSNLLKSSFLRFGSKKRRGVDEVESISGVYWPSDLLPEDVPQARILTFGYDSDVTKLFGGTVNQGNILAHGKDLTYALNRNREDCKGRPLIFIGHSLGGIIIKEVLRFTERHEDLSVTDIHKSTTLVMFLGTPHRGSSYAPLGETVRRIVSASGFDTNDRNLRALHFDSIELELGREEFGRQVRNGHFSVKTFQESQGLKDFRGLTEKVVPDFSSSLDDPMERAEHINANHREMCRFSSKLDSGYQQVKGELCSHLKRVQADKMQLLESLNAKEEEKKSADLAVKAEACLRSLCFVDIDTRAMNIDKSIEGTCEWLYLRPEYQTWLERGKPNLLWLKGKVGSGKSVMMKRAWVNSTLPDITSYTSVTSLAYFFNARGSPLEHSTLGLLRSLLYQLLKGYPYLQANILPLYEKKLEMHGEIWEWHLEELKEAFKDLLSQVKGGRTMLFIDALDECDEASSRSTVRYLETLTAVSKLGEADVKICLSSRLYPNFYSANSLELHADENNRSDIERYARGQLFRDEGNGIQQEIVEEIVHKASGVFLWVILVVDRLEKARDDGETAGRMQQILRTIPEKLKELLKQTVQSLTAQDEIEIRESLRIFRWVLCATRSLSPLELRYALAFDETAYTSASQFDVTSVESFYQSDLQVSKIIRARTRGLIEVKNADLSDNNPPRKVVQFIHESARQFFLQQDGFRLLDSDFNEGSILESNYRLASVCFKYLCIKELEGLPGSQKDPQFLSWSEAQMFHEDLEIRYPLLKYAVTASLEHSKNAEPLCIADDAAGELLFEAMCSCYRVWIYVHDLDVTRSQSQGIHLGLESSLGLVAAEFNMIDWVNRLLKQGLDVNKPSGEKYYTMLQAAAATGHEAMIKILLDNDADPCYVAGFYGTPLHAAASQGNKAIINLLLANGSDVNSRGGDYDTVLQAACRGCKDDTTLLEMLLNANANVNAQGGRHGNALQACAFYGNIAALQLMISNGADINGKGGEHGSALQAAAYVGHEEIVQLLIESGADISISIGNYGNALWAAALEGHKSVVMRLLRAKQNSEVNDVSKEDSHIEVLSTLEESSHELLQSVSTFRWFYKAAEEGEVAVMAKLIEAGVDINARGGFTSSAWHAAAVFGWPEVMRLLISQPNGEPDMADALGRTPLWHAASCGELDIVRQLIDTNHVSYDTVTLSGRNLLWFAAHDGHKEIVDLMLEKGVDPGQPDRDGDSPLWAARHNYHTAIETLLLGNGSWKL